MEPRAPLSTSLRRPFLGCPALTLFLSVSLTLGLPSLHLLAPLYLSHSAGSSPFGLGRPEWSRSPASVFPVASKQQGGKLPAFPGFGGLSTRNKRFKQNIVGW